MRGEHGGRVTSLRETTSSSTFLRICVFFWVFFSEMTGIYIYMYIYICIYIYVYIYIHVRENHPNFCLFTSLCLLLGWEWP